jgi:hypothetical protein
MKSSAARTVFAHTARTGVVMARIGPLPVCHADSTTQGRTSSPPTVMWSGSSAVMNTCRPPHSEPAVSNTSSEPRAPASLRLLALAAGLVHNHDIGDPARHFAAYGH